jgi:hypothetical protein
MRPILLLNVLPVVVLGLAGLGCDESSSATPAPATPPASATAPAPATAATPTSVTPTTAANPATSAAASASAPSEPPPAASPADPQDAKLGAFEKEVAQAIVNAAVGKPVDAKWIAKDPQQKVSNLTDPDDKKLLDVLGKDLTIVLVDMELGELAQPSPSEHHEINGSAIMLTDGTIRWGTAGSRHATSELAEPTPGVEKSAPAASEAGGRLIKALGTSCKMPWLAPSDLAQVPEGVQKDLITDVGATKTTCGEVAKVKADWRTHIDDVRVLVKGNGHFGFLSSVFGVDEPGDKLVLSPLHAEVLEDAQLKKK